MKVTSLALANYVLDIAEASRVDVSWLKLQGMAYFCHGYHLAVTERPLIDEQVEAARFGPVIPSLLDEFSSGEDVRIERRAVDYRFVRGGSVAFGVKQYAIDRELGPGPVRRMVIRIVDRVWESYGELDDLSLLAEATCEGSPWEQVMKKHDGCPPKGTDIPNDLLKSYFHQMLLSNRDRSELASA